MIFRLPDGSMREIKQLNFAKDSHYFTYILHLMLSKQCYIENNHK